LMWSRVGSVWWKCRDVSLDRDVWKTDAEELNTSWTAVSCNAMYTDEWRRQQKPLKRRYRIFYLATWRHTPGNRDCDSQPSWSPEFVLPLHLGGNISVIDFFKEWENNVMYSAYHKH
jgi:hypothetical protein